ncbi:MAG TPA: carotenoid biosynthesis protein [Bacteroidales bacterium]|nr:carotenoid biosynthesis protein [Bacteroidales bacterium]HNS46163.1 carotenoid biosynthesis protein [Bacteroidales bacterium]
MAAKSLKPAYFVFFLILYYGVGIAGLVTPSQHDLFIRFTPYSLLLNLLILLAFHAGWDRKTILFGLFVLVAGFLIEAVGVATGNVFGTYVYGKILGPGIGQTPLLIGVNWFFLVYTTWDLSSRISRNPWLRILLASVLMVVFDLFLEPAAVKLEMWTWEGGVIPVRNYLAWFVTSLLFFILAFLTKMKFRNRMSVPLWLILLAFFILLNLLME